MRECSGGLGVKNCSGGLLEGLGGKGDSLGLGEAGLPDWPRLRVELFVTAAVPRELRIDPCEKKTKGNECARWREGAPTGRWCHGHVVPISTYYSGNGGTKFSKKIWLIVGL